MLREFKIGKLVATSYIANKDVRANKSEIKIVSNRFILQVKGMIFTVGIQ
ncbi:MAG: hypothetical protein ACRCX2_04320 [Paraclostridium sp.]